MSILDSNGNIPHQLIIFGAPGTGKSYRINKFLNDKNIKEECIFRTTFHPDSDYSTFVGSYKPIVKDTNDRELKQKELIAILNGMKNSDMTYFVQKFGAKYWSSLKQKSRSDKINILKSRGLSETYSVEIDKGIAIGEEYHKGGNQSTISYTFVPQTFTSAYLQAHKNPKQEVYIIIEEINRGNCAQIFGDIFQLLDRDKEGKSAYSIKADTDLCNYLELNNDFNHSIIQNGQLRLPSNLYIFATMNTSDQSLFPMDSAFKRRWSWEYVPINADCPDSPFKINIGNKTYKWPSFLSLVNERIHKLSDSEDKQMGYYFIKDNIDVEEFKSKVMFYLWSEVCKEYENAGSFFKYKDAGGKEIEFTFNGLFPTNESTNAILQGFMEYLKVEEV